MSRPLRVNSPGPGLRQLRGALLGQRPILPLPAAGDPHSFAILGHRPSRNRHPRFFQLVDQPLVAVGLRLVFLVDQLLKLQADGGPRDVFAVFGLGATDKKASAAVGFPLESASTCRRRLG